jgi:hypothetical protein
MVASFSFPSRQEIKYTAKGALKKDAYRLYTKKGHFESAMKIANFFGAKIEWVTVTVDTTTKAYSAYRGDLSEIPSPPTRIPMHPKKHVPKYDCLARDVPDEAISQCWSNIEGTVSG